LYGKYNTIIKYRYAEIVRWMDSVDKGVESIAREVSSLEEFEKERRHFQVNKYL